MILDRVIVMDNVSGLAADLKNSQTFWLFRENMD